LLRLLKPSARKKQRRLLAEKRATGNDKKPSKRRVYSNNARTKLWRAEKHVQPRNSPLRANRWPHPPPSPLPSVLLLLLGRKITCGGGRHLYLAIPRQRRPHLRPCALRARHPNTDLEQSRLLLVAVVVGGARGKRRRKQQQQLVVVLADAPVRFPHA